MWYRYGVLSYAISSGGLGGYIIHPVWEPPSFSPTFQPHPQLHIQLRADATSAYPIRHTPRDGSCRYRPTNSPLNLVRSATTRPSPLPSFLPSFLLPSPPFARPTLAPPSWPPASPTRNSSSELAAYTPSAARTPPDRARGHHS